MSDGKRAGIFCSLLGTVIPRSKLVALNAHDRLTIDQLRYALKTAIASGLQLAIFNSCDGLGLAHQLVNLHIPQMIRMREPVPDLVTQEFLKYFLRDFAAGESLDTIGANGEGALAAQRVTT